MRLETLILKSLIENEDYTREVLPFIQDEYFAEASDRVLFNVIKTYIDKYNTLPMREALVIELDNSNVQQEQFAEAMETLDDFSSIEPKDLPWLVDQTESFCKEKAIYNAIMRSITIYDGEDKEYDTDGIPALLQTAIAVSFDKSVGHDLIEDSDARYEFYQRSEEHLPFDLEYFNKMTGGGVTKKTLSIFVAGTNVGKSLTMCHMAAANMLDGKKVLYITLEMAAEKIAKRIDANLLNISINDLESTPYQNYNRSIERLKARTTGKLIVKEYPPAAVSSSNFRYLLKELNLKKDFVPDVIYIDYLNLCVSSRFKNNNNIGSYFYIKAVAEELRGLAMEFNLPIFSATQLNRSGMATSEVELTDTSESIGLPYTVDNMWALVQTQELKERNQLMVKALKMRDNDSNFGKFYIGMDRNKQRLYDIDQSEASDEEDRPVMDNSEFGGRVEDERKGGKRRWNFDEFK